MVEERIGPYRILEKISETGQAVSYKAVHEHLNRYVFLKLLPGTVHTSDERRNRFLQEARALARVDHPAVVRVYDAGEFDGKLYLASEFLTGPDFHTLVSESGELSWERTKDVARVLLEGLRAIHAAGIVHRDIKPSNIVLGDKGPKLADFGLARLIDNPQGTRSDTFVGTPAYIAPEILQGEQATPRSDLFALGGTLFELLTGERAFKGETFQAVLARILDHDPLADGHLDIPDDGRVFLSALLDKNPERRPKDADEALGLLEGVHPHGSPFRVGRLLLLAIPIVAVLIYFLTLMPARISRKADTSRIPTDSALFQYRIPGFSKADTASADSLEEPILNLIEVPDDSIDADDEQGVADSLPSKLESHPPETPIESAIPSAIIPSQLKLWIFSTPWAEISLNDSVIDTTPLAEPLILNQGSHEFTFRHPSFLSITRLVEVEEGGTESLMVAMQESTAFLRVSAEPWATVDVDGDALGVTPFTSPIPVRPGYRHVVARNPYHGEWEDLVFIDPAETVAVTVRFGEK